MAIWLDFASNVFVQIALLVAPGFIVLRLFRCSRLLSALLSPVVSLPLFCALGIIYCHVGIVSSWVSVAIVPTSVLAVVYAVLLCIRMMRNGSVGQAKLSLTIPREYYPYIALTYICCVSSCAYIFLASIDDPSFFLQQYDNYFHLNAIQGMAESGNWSILTMSPYLESADNAISPHGSGGIFYPGGFHIVAALSMSALSSAGSIAQNAAIFVYIAIVFPSSLFLMLWRIGKGNKRVLFYGALLALGFAAFPWNMMKSVLFPNIAGICMLPYTVFLFMRFTDGESDLFSRTLLGVLFILAMASCGIAHPNTFFAAAAFLVPYSMHLIYCKVLSSNCFNKDTFMHRVGRRVIPYFASLSFLLCFAIAWYLIFQLPFLQSIAMHGNKPIEEFDSAIVDIFSFRLWWQAPSQVFLAILVLVGAVRMFRSSETRCIVMAFVAFAVMLLLGMIDCGPVRNLVVGFSYSDARRLFGFYALAAIPLAAFGLEGMDSFIRQHITGTSLVAKAAIAAVLSISVVGLVYTPQNPLMGNRKLDTCAIDKMRDYLYLLSHGGWNSLTVEEKAFISEVLETIPDGSLVINVPCDGSVYAYGDLGIRTYYRYQSSFEAGGENETGSLVRTQLNSIALNPDVREAVNNIGAEYVILLDADGSEESIWVQPSDDPAMWTGITSITETTPGFELVLTEGDMRLYHIMDSVKE